MKKGFFLVLIISILSIPIYAQYFFSFENQDDTYYNPDKMSDDKLSGRVFVKNIKNQDIRMFDLRSFLRNNKNYTDVFSVVDEYGGIFVVRISTKYISDSNERNWYENRFVIINPLKGTKEIVELPNNYRYMYPVSDNEMLVSTINDSQQKYNSFYKKYQTYFNLDKLYVYNFITGDKQIIFDNSLYNIDFDNNLCDSQFIFDKATNILLIIEELESKYDTETSKPQRLRLFNTNTKNFIEIDSVYDPDAYSSGLFEISSFKNSRVLYKKRSGSEYRIYIKDINGNSISFGKNLVLDIIEENKYLSAVKISKFKIFVSQKKMGIRINDSLFSDIYNLRIISLDNGVQTDIDTKTLIVDERCDFSTFSNDSVYRSRFIDLYVDFVNEDLFN